MSHVMSKLAPRSVHGALGRLRQADAGVWGRRLATGLLAAVSTGAISQALAQTTPNTATLTTTGQTNTVVTAGADGHSATVTTSTVSQNSGFNSFNNFSVGSNFTVNLVVPSNAQHLINIVSGQQVMIDGIINGYKGSVDAANANRGGDIYFVAPKGFVVGPEGVINVGGLTVVTPKDDNNDIAARLLAGTGLDELITLGGGTDLSDQSIQINGRVNALDRVRLKSKSVGLGQDATLATGVSALEAVDASNAKIFAEVVNTQGLQVGQELVYHGGDIEIVGDQSVTLDGNIYAKAGGSQAAGSLSVKSSSSISVGATGYIDLFRTSGQNDGLVALAVEDTHSNYSGKTTADATISIQGSISGGDLAISAKASAKTDYTDDSKDFEFQTIAAGLLAGVNGNYLDAESSAVVQVSGNASLVATNQLSLTADSTTRVSMPVAALGGTVQAAVIAGLIDSTAQVQVTGGFMSAKDLTISAKNTTSVDVSATVFSLSSDEKGAVAAAYGSAKAHTEASVGKDVDVVAGNVSVSARNDHSFSTTASADANGEGYVGAAVAVSDQDLQTKAAFAADLSNGTSLSVTAATDTTVNKTAAATQVGSGFVANHVLKAGGYLTKAYEAWKKIDQIKDAQGDEHPRVGGAVAVGLSDQETTAQAGAAGNSITTSGAVVVAARTNDAGIRNNATAAGASTDTSSTTDVSVVGAVSYGDYDHTTLAEILPGSTITASNVGVAAETLAPITVDWLRYDLKDLKAKLNGNLGLANTVASSFTSAKSEANDVGVAGSVNINLLGADTRAWIGEDTDISVGFSAAQPLADGIGIDWGSVGDANLAVHAKSLLDTLVVGGQYSPTMAGGGSGGNGGTGEDANAKSVGGSYTAPSQTTRTVAGLGAGVSVAAKTVAVDAHSDNQLIVVSPSSGRGGGIGVAGLANYATIDNQTVAVVSDKASVVATDSVKLKADQDLMVVNVAAALPLSAGNSAVGVGVAVNDVSADTRAGVFDTSPYSDIPGQVRHQYTPGISTKDLEVDAVNTGWVTALGVAGTAASQNETPEKKFEKAKDAAAKKAGDAQSKATEDTDDWISQILQTFKDAAEPPKEDSSDKPSFSLAAAGSAAVNLTELNASAIVQNVFVSASAGAPTAISLSAINNPIIMANAGAGSSVDAGEAPSVGIAGAVAMNVTDNHALAEMRNTSSYGLHSLDIQAINGGVQTAAAIAAALNEDYKGQSGTGAGSVSASVVISTDTAHAELIGSLIEGHASGSDVNVSAYNAPKIGAGGGAGYQGGKGGLGVGVTVIELSDDGSDAATEARVRDTVLDVGSLHVAASDPALILGLAASGGRGAENFGATGSGAFISSDRTTRAEVSAQFNGASPITATGSVVVEANSKINDDFESLALGRSTNASTDTGYDFSGAGSAGDLRDDAGDALDILGSRSGGIMIAVAGQGQSVGKPSSGDKSVDVGASFAGVFSDDDHQAVVDNANIHADDIVIHAGDEAVRASLAAGYGSGGNYGFTGSGAVVQDGGSTTASFAHAASSQAHTVSVEALDSSVTGAFAGNISRANKAAGGASVSVIDTTKDVSATLDSATLKVDQSLTIAAAEQGRAYNLAITAESSDGISIGAASAISLVDGGAQATVSDSHITGKGDVTVSGEDSSSIVTAALGWETGKAGGGVALAVNRRGDGVRAGANVSASDANAKTVTIEASGESSVKTLAAGMSAGTKFQGSGSIVINSLDGDVVARLGDVSFVTATNNVAVTAKSEDTIDVLAGAMAFGDKAAAGISLTTNFIQGDTRALLDDAYITADAGGAAVTVGPESTQVQGVAVNASSINTVRLGAVSGGQADNAVGGNVVYSRIGGQTEAGGMASLFHSDTAGQQFDIAATDDSEVSTFVGTFAFAEGVGVAGGLTVAQFNRDVIAHGEGTLEAAGKGRIAANSTQEITDLNLGMGSGKLAIAGAISVVTFDSDTKALGANSFMTVGSLDVSAKNHTDANLNAGVLASGNAAIGGGITVVTSDNDTVAALGLNADGSTAGVIVHSSGPVSVKADHDADFTLRSVGGGLGSKVGVAGMGAVLLTSDTTRASVVNTGVIDDAQPSNLTIQATEEVDASLLAGGVATGQLVGVGGAVGLIKSDNSVTATFENSSAKVGDVKISAQADRDLDAIVVSAGLGKAGVAASVGVVLVGGGDASGEGSDSTPTLGLIDSLQGSAVDADTKSRLTANEAAQANGAGQVNAQGRVNAAQSGGTAAHVADAYIEADALTLEALDHTDTRQDAGALGAGFGGVGAGVAVTKVGVNVDAAVIGAGSQVRAQDTVIQARATGEDETHGYVGAAGGVGASAGAAVTLVGNDVTASLGGSMTHVASVKVAAADATNVSSQVVNVAAGGGAIGGTVSMAEKTGSVSASTADGFAIYRGDRLEIDADASGSVSAEGVGAAGGVAAAVNGAYVEAKDSTDVHATVGQGTTLAHLAHGLWVSATRTPQVHANALGVTVGGAAALGASVAKAEVSGDVAATLEDGVVLQDFSAEDVLPYGSDLTVRAEMLKGQDDTVRADSVAGVGGGLVGASGAVATASNTSNVRATVGEGFSTNSFGFTYVLANRESNETAHASGITVGGALALGATYSEATAGGEIVASLPGDIRAADGSAAHAGDIGVTAQGDDELTADSLAGAGGVVAGQAAVARTSHSTAVRAEVLDSAQAAPVIAASLDVNAQYTAKAHASADTTQAAVFGGSGADAGRTIDTSVTARVGDNADFQTYTGVSVVAHQDTQADGGVTAASGGVINGAAGISNTTITPKVSAILGHNVGLAVYDVGGALTIDASNTIAAKDQAKLDVGGGIPIARAETRIFGDSASTVNIGKDSDLSSAGMVEISAYSTESAASDAKIATYGAVGAAGGLADAELTARQDVTLGQNVKVWGGDRITIGAGHSAQGFDTNVLANANNDTYNYTGLPVDTDPDVKARAYSYSNLTIGTGASIEGVRDVNLFATDGAHKAHSDGTGHNPYLELFSSTIDRSDSDNGGTGVLTVNGSVHAGVMAKQTVEILADGTVIRGAQSQDIPVERAEFKVRAALEQRISELTSALVNETDPSKIASLQAELDVMHQLLSTAPPEALTAAQRNQLLIQRNILTAQRAVVAANNPAQGGGDSGVPLTAAQLTDALFDIDQQIAGINDQLNATSFQPTYAQIIGDIYAAAGDVNMTARTLAGAGSVTAEGGATISVINRSTDYLIVNGLNIPVGDGRNGGHIQIDGGASGAQAPGLALHQIDIGQAPVINISNESESGRPGIYLQGSIANLGGDINILNRSGDIAQFAPIAGKTLSVTATNGTYAVNLPNGIYTDGAAPEAAWYSTANYSNDVNTNIALVANSMFNLDAKGNLIWLPGGVTNGRTNELLFTDRQLLMRGVCGPHCLEPWYFFDMISNKNGGYDPSYQYAWGGDGGSYIPMGIVPIINPIRNFAVSSQPKLDPKDGISAQALIVNARDINITAPARIGRNNNLSVQINQSLEGDIAAIRAAAKARGVTLTGVISLSDLARDWGQISTTSNAARTSIVNVGLRSIQITREGDQLVGVSYDFDHDRLVTDGVTGAGGGSISLTGHIFSTTTYGALQVNSGLGDIRVSNLTGLGLTLGDIDAGNSAVGTVKITDLNKTDSQDRPQTTWFIYNDGVLNTYSNYHGVTGYSALDLVPNQTAYNPATGYRYHWTMSRTASRTIQGGVYNTGFDVYNSQTTPWQWAQSDWTVSNQYFGLDDAPSLPFFQSRYRGEILSSSAWWLTTADHSFAWSHDGDALLKGTVPTRIKVINDLSVKADNPIAVQFIGNRQGNVEISSIGSIEVAGTVTNPLGTTQFGVTGDLSDKAGARIVSQDLRIATGGTIGRDDNPLSLAMNGGALNVYAQGGHTDIDIAGRVTIDRIDSHDRVSLAASLGIDNNADSLISSRQISLASSEGNIGDVNGEPLHIQTFDEVGPSGALVLGRLDASAKGSIAIEQANGDLRVRQVTSQTGDVRVGALSGAILNAKDDFTIDVANQQRLADVWSDLGLADPNNVLKAVASFERNVTVQQAERVRILNQMTVVNGKITAIGGAGQSTDQVAAARAIYSAQAQAAGGLASPPTDAQIIAYVQSRYDAIEAFANQTFGQQRPTGFNSTNLAGSFVYTLDPNSALYKTLTKGVWTETQLTQVINGTALIPVDDTTILKQTPNVTAAGRVDLASTGGGIGADLPPLQIIAKKDVPLTVEERALLAAAGPGDITATPLAEGFVLSLRQGAGQSALRITTQPATALTPDQQAAFAAAAPGDIVVTVLADGYMLSVPGGAGRPPVQIMAIADDPLTAGQLAAVAAAGPGDITASPLSYQLSVKQQRLFNISAGGAVTASADKAIYLGSAGTLNLDYLYTPDQARVIASGSIFGVITAKDLIIEAHGGSIGQGVGNPLYVDLSGDLKSARATQNISIARSSDYAVGNDDLRVGVVFAGGDLSLSASGGSLLSAFGNSDEVRFQARNIMLLSDHDVGAADARLQVQLSDTTGQLTAHGQNIYVHEPVGTLRIADLTGATAHVSGGDIAFNGQTSVTDLDVTGTGDVALGGAITFDQLTVGGKSVHVNGNLGGSGISLTATGDLVVGGRLGPQETLSLSGGYVHFLDSGRAVVGEPGFQFGFSHATTTITAGAGGFVIDAAAGSRIDTVGALDITSTGKIDLGGTVAAGDTHVTGGDVSLGKGVHLITSGLLSVEAATLTLGDDAQVTSDGMTRIHAANGFTAGDGVSLSGGDTIEVSTNGADVVAGKGFSLNGVYSVYVTTGSSGAIKLGADSVLGVLVGGLTLNSGAIAIGDRGALGGDDTLDAQAAGAFTFGQGVQLTGNSALTLTAGTGLGFGDDANLQTTGALNLSGKSIAFGKRATLGAGGLAKLAAGANGLSIDTGLAAYADHVILQSLGGTSLGGAALIHGAGAVEFTDKKQLTFGDKVTVTADAGDVLIQGQALAAGGLDVTAGGAITASLNGGNTSLGAGSHLTAAKATNVTGALALTVGAGSSVKGDSVTLSGDSLTLGADTAVQGAKSVDVQAKQTLAIGDRDQFTGGTLRLAGDKLTLGSGVGLQGTAATLSAQTSGLIIGSDLTATVDTLTLTDSGDLTVGDRASVTSKGAVSVTAKSIQTASATRLSGTVVDVKSSGGAASFGANADLSGQVLTVNASKALAFGTGSKLKVTGGNDLTLSGETVDLGSQSQATAGKAVNITSKVGAIQIGVGSVLTGPNVVINAKTDLTAGGNINATLAGIDLRAGHDLSLGAGSVSAATTLALNAAGALTANATMSAGQGATVTAAQTLRVDSLTATGKVQIQSTAGSVQVGQVKSDSVADDAIQIAAAQQIDGLSVSGNHVTAKSGGLVASSGSGIGSLADPLRIDVRKVSATATTGDVALSSAGDLAATGGAGGTFRVSSAGALSLDHVTAHDLRGSADKALTVTASTADTGTLTSLTSIDATLTVNSSLQLAGPSITATLKGPNTGLLTLGVTGAAAGSLAGEANLQVTAPGGVRFDPFQVNHGSLALVTPELDIPTGRVGDRVEVTTPDVSLLIATNPETVDSNTIKAPANGTFMLNVKNGVVKTGGIPAGNLAGSDPSMMAPPPPSPPPSTPPTPPAASGDPNSVPPPTVIVSLPPAAGAAPGPVPVEPPPPVNLPPGGDGEDVQIASDKDPPPSDGV